MTTPINDGGPFSVDTKKALAMLTTCEKFTFYLGDLPSFLMEITPPLPAMSGAWERTVTFTAEGPELRALAACFTDSSKTLNPAKKFIIEMKIDWITRAQTSKKLHHQSTRNSIMLGILLKETKPEGFTRSVENAPSVGRCLLLIRTTEEDKRHATSGALLEWQSEEGVDRIGISNKSLRDYFAGMALQGFIAHANITVNKRRASQNAYKYADAMLAQRNSEVKGRVG